jgi:hypothetical protein
MGVEIIQHHADLFGFWKMKINQILHAPSEILFRSLVGDFDVPPACQGLQKHEQVASTFPSILKIITPRYSIPHWQRQPGFAHHLIGHLVKTDHWKGWLIRLGLQIQNIFHIAWVFGEEAKQNQAGEFPGDQDGF